MADKKVLRLESIAGAEAMDYKWPLTLGRGSLRGAEDEHDQVRKIFGWGHCHTFYFLSEPT